MSNDLIISTQRINKRLKKVEKKPSNLLGWASGHDFPDNEGNYPASPLNPYTTWKKFYHVDRKIQYIYDKDFGGWISEQSYDIIGRGIDNFNYIQVIENYDVVISRILIGLKSFDKIIDSKNLKNLIIKYTSTVGDGTLVDIDSKDLIKRTSSFYTYINNGFFPFNNSFELFLMGNDFVLSNFYVNFSISYRLIG